VIHYVGEAIVQYNILSNPNDFKKFLSRVQVLNRALLHAIEARGGIDAHAQEFNRLYAKLSEDQRIQLLSWGGLHP
jgi:hypothetical protein